MRYLLILFLSFFSISAFSQGIYNKAATNIKQNRLMADSVLGVPRDTSATNNATFNGAPVGDSGRIAYQFGKFWGHDGSGWNLLGSQSFDINDWVRNQTSIVQTGNYRISGNGLVGNTMTVGSTTFTGSAPFHVYTLPSFGNISAIFEGTIQHAPGTLNSEGVILSQLKDSISGLYGDFVPYYLTNMVTLPPDVVQPSDSVVGAISKLQAQLQAISGKYIENQDTIYQLAKFTLDGSSKIRSTTQRPNLTIQKGPSDTTYAILTFDDFANNRLGYIGAPSFTDPNSLTLAALRSRMYYIARDTSSHIFGNYNGSTSAFYTYMRNGHWRFYRQSTNPFDHDAVNYDPAYTMQVDGQLRFDTLRALNFTSATTPITGSTGKYLSVNASGDVGLYDLRATDAWFHGMQARYTATNDTMDVISAATNWNYRIKLRRTGAVMYDAFFIKGNNGQVGIGTVNVNSSLTINGSVSKAATTVTGTTTLDATHCNVDVNNTANVVINLPAVATCIGREYTISKASNNAFTVTITANGAETINGVNTNVLGAQFNSITIWNTGTTWRIK